MKYLALLRLQDQYLQLGFAFGAGVFLGDSTDFILIWASITLLVSFVGFMVNELVDRNDTDLHSWNPVHVGLTYDYDMRIVWAMGIGFTVGAFILAITINMVVWTAALYFFTIGYSLPPLRFKARFAMDTIAQMLAWLIIPFIAPVWHVGRGHEGILFILVATCLGWGIFLPYQLGDISADIRAKLHNTYVVWGIKKSTIFGAILGFVGIAGFFILNMHIVVPWALPLVIVAGYSLWRYAIWTRMKDDRTLEVSMQWYATSIKPWTQLFLPYTIGLWLFLR